MRHRLLTTMLVVAGGGLGLTGCGAAVRTLSFPSPGPVPSATTSTTADTLADPAALGEPAVPGVTVAPAVSMGPGRTTLTGVVVGPAGGVVGATVEVERLVGDRSATRRVRSGAGGVWRLGGVLGGRYRVRAWMAPTLAMTSGTVFYIADGATQSLALRPMSFGAPTVTSSFAPDPVRTGAATTVGVEVTRGVVSPDGTVAYRPVVGRDVELLEAGEWTVTSSTHAVTSDEGTVAFIASCGAVGEDPLTVVVGQRIALPLHVPACTAAPTPATTATTTTIPAATTTTSEPGGPPSKSTTTTTTTTTTAPTGATPTGATSSPASGASPGLRTDPR